MSVFRRQKEPPPGDEATGPGRRRRTPGGQRGRGDLPSRAADGAGAQERFILDALGDLHDTVVREVMTPRVDVVALSIPVTADGVTRAVRESGHSCFPVYGDNLDDLIGILYVNDLFRAGWGVGRSDRVAATKEPIGASPEGAGAGPGTAPPTQGDLPAPSPVDISRRLRQPFLVPESQPVLEVLAEMRRQRRGFAVVVDEHGGVEGVLTVKDLLGALVGDLPDEFDSGDEAEVVRVDATRWLVDGRLSVDDVRDRLDVNVPEGEYVTLGGFLFDAFGHIPEEGEALTVDGWELRVAEMDKRRIAMVVAKRPHPATEPREPAASIPELGGADDGSDGGSQRTAVG